MDMDASENDTVLNGSLDYTAVSDQTVFNRTLSPVNGRRFITDLGIDLTVSPEQLLTDIGIKKIHVRCKIGTDGIDLLEITAVLKTVDLQVIDTALQYIAVQAVHIVA